MQHIDVRVDVDAHLVAPPERRAPLVELLRGGQESRVVLRHPVRLDAAGQVEHPDADRDDGGEAEDVERADGDEHDVECRTTVRTRHTPGVPEVLEVELARRAVADVLSGAVIRSVLVTDDLVVGPGVDQLVAGAEIEGLDRRGKQLVMVTDRGRVGVHFGMTGRWLLDDVSTIGELAYGSGTDDPRWDRWVLAIEPATGGGPVRLRLHDPRRLARVLLDPDVDRLGPDALSLTRRELAAALARRTAPVKAVLLDQETIAGLGNMLVDEVLWWSAIDPRRMARSLTDDEVAALHSAIKRRLPVMLRRGGSHTGVLSPDVRRGDVPCPRDGAPLLRATVGGRATVWCSAHQR